MANALIELPVPYIGDFGKGRPIFNGQIYVGVVDLDPEIPANQKQIVGIQENGTEVNLPQPVETSPGGYPTYNGAPIRLSVDGAYSLKILDRKGEQEYYFSNVHQGAPLTLYDTGFVSTYDTLSEAINGQYLTDGQVLNLKERTLGGGGSAVWDVTLTAEVTVNGYNIVQCVSDASLSLVLRGNEIRSYGIAANGITNDAAAFYSYMIQYKELDGRDSDNSNGKPDIKIDSQITLPSGSKYKLTGVTLNFSDLQGDVTAILVNGEEFGSSISMTTDTLYPSNQVTITDASSISEGDIIALSSDRPWSTNTLTSEYSTVMAVLGNAITVGSSVLSEYNVSDNAIVRKFDQGTSIYLNDITAFGNTSFDQDFMIASRCYNSGYGGEIFIYDFKRRGLKYNDCVIVRGEGIAYFKDLDMDGFGYGISTVGSQWCAFSDIIGDNCRHLTTSGDSAGQGMLARWQSYGNLISHNSRDAIVDTHDGACDFTYSSITGTGRIGNDADDGVTMEGARIHIGKINMTRPKRFGLYLAFGGMGDTGRRSFITIDDAVVDGDGDTGDYLVNLKNAATVNNRVDMVRIGSVCGEGERGIFIDCAEGGFEFVDINADIEVRGDHGIEAVSSANGRVKKLTLSGSVVQNSTTASDYPIMINGGTWEAEHPGIEAMDVDLAFMTLEVTNEQAGFIRNIDSDINIVGLRKKGVITGSAIRNDGIGITRQADSQRELYKFSYNPSSISGGSSISTAFATPGVIFGDFTSVSWDEDLEGILLESSVTAIDEVTVTFTNPTSGAIDLTTANLKIAVN